jgi:hypothetical protein
MTWVAGMTLVANWIPAFAGMTWVAGMTLVANWVPAFAGMNFTILPALCPALF